MRLLLRAAVRIGSRHQRLLVSPPDLLHRFGRTALRQRLQELHALPLRPLRPPLRLYLLNDVPVANGVAQLVPYLVRVGQLGHYGIGYHYRSTHPGGHGDGLVGVLPLRSYSPERNARHKWKTLNGGIHRSMTHGPKASEAHCTHHPSK